MCGMPLGTNGRPDPAESRPMADSASAPLPQRALQGAGSLAQVCATIDAQVDSFLTEELTDPLLQAVQEQTRVALGVISAALDTYGLADLALSYNGGKDCLVLLILLLAGISQHARAHPSLVLPDLLPSIYIVPGDPFPQVTRFVEATADRYKLRLARYDQPMKQAFRLYLQGEQQRGEAAGFAQHASTDQDGHAKTNGTPSGGRGIQAVLVGMRRTDPHGKILTHFDRTDRGWPDFMRVHPIIDWHYREIWGFLRHLGIPYCELYDQGYTSLGGMHDTHPNPALKHPNQTTFRPAYDLLEDREERLGRA